MSRLNASLLNASGIGAMGCKGKATMEDRIRESMVVWYDLAKQGATNEGMAADPRIIDHSGNGHHATCYNFAWSGMSGVGGYVYDFSAFSQYNSDGEWYNDYIHITNRKDGVVSSTLTELYLLREGTEGETVTVPSFTIQVENPNNLELVCDYYNGGSLFLQDISKNGIHVIPENVIPISANGVVVVRFRLNDYSGDGQNLNITITQIPLYPNALVSDGVDDYCLVEGLPLLNKERGYTVIAKRKWLQDINRNVLVSRNTTWVSEASGGVDGAFNIECNTASCYSFGKANVFDFNNLDEFIYQTSKSYNGKDLAIGDKEDNNHLCIAAINKGTNWFSSIAIYSLLLFNRDLSADEIEWVKTNLMSE